MSDLDLDLEAIKARAVAVGQFFVGDSIHPVDRAAETLAVLDVPALLARVAELEALTVTCSCGTSSMTYEGPEPDCPVHGAVRAFSEAQRRIAELEAERDGDPIRRLNEVIKDATVQIRNAEGRGYDRAVANLRDSQQRARYGADQAIMRIAADYLEATKESTDG